MFRFFLGLAILLYPGTLHALSPGEKRHGQSSAQVTVRAPGPGCAVDLDDQKLGKTDDHGVFVAPEVEPGDHYLHLRCANEDEKGFFISPRSGENLVLNVSKAKEDSSPQANPPLSLAETMVRLSELVQQAVQLRARGRVDEAVERLRSALKLDAENSDLHRELGITFLLGKDWKRARVEMLEAIRHDPTDADAYNGLGYALEKMGDLNEAVKQYRVATQLDPADPTYRTHYFDILSKLSQEKAKKK
jgi:Flp pilus assembly protein TadD